MKDWEIVDYIKEFGEISPIDLSIKWPQIDVKAITSPPKGRSRKNVHNMSHSESESPEKKKMKKDPKKNAVKENPEDAAKASDDAEESDEEKMKKVADFVKKLEAKKGKYTQSKINFQPVKTSKSSW